MTAWVLSVASRVGLGSDTRAELVSKLESMLDPAKDAVGLNSTTVVSTVIVTLAELAPSSQRIVELVDRLIEGAQDDEKDGTVAWGKTFSSRSQRSVPHTARAIVALSRVAAASPRSVAVSDTIRAANRWLCAPSDQNEFAKRLGNEEEQIRRPMKAGQADVLIVGHFAAAWVARALLATGDGTSDIFIRTAVKLVQQQQKMGIWRWGDSEPVWMTYQGAAALKEYLLRGLGWPP